LVTTTGAPQGAYAQGGNESYAVKLGATRVITYAYDGVNRVTEAATCPGNDYQYSYDLAGNRTGETLNGALAQRLGYDAANAVVTATTPAGTAIYGYDGAGNLLGDGANSYSYDALSRLTALTPLSGSAPAETYGYNGDGTLVTQTVGGVPTQYAQDLAAPSGQSQVLAATTGTGAPVTTDYLYGNGTERLGGQAGGASGTRTWYGTDLQGSVRSTTDDGANLSAGSGATVASPAGYDPCGTPEWRVPPAPFGYTGEVQDPTTGLVNLRARTYNPLVGQFLTRDPLEQQTGQAYAYAGGDPVNNADPSGQDAQSAGFPPRCSNDPVRDTVEVAFLRKALLGFRQDANCNIPIPGVPGGGAEVVVREEQNGRTGSLYVVAPLDQLLPGYQAVEARAQRDVRALGGTGPQCTRTAGAQLYTPDGGLTGVGLGGLQLGGSDAFGADPNPQFAIEGTPGQPVTAGAFVPPGGGVATVPGLIYYQRVSPLFPYSGCLTSFNVQGLLHCGYQFIIGDDLDALRSTQGGVGGALAKVVAVVDIGSNILLLVPIAGEAARYGVKGLSKVVLSGLLRRGVSDAELHVTTEVGVPLTKDLVDRAEQGVREHAGGKSTDRRLDVGGGCGCFVAGTRVATPGGSVSIEKLRTGMRVLAENPRTGKVEAEPVVRLITDHVSPLLAVELSDGTTLKVTADHPFWVNSGAHLAHSGWLHAEHLRPGDRLRTAKGKDVTVVRVRRNVGHAVVYTLTVAHDHTFFVGSARVLVHNAGPCPVNPLAGRSVEVEPGTTDLSEEIINRQQQYRDFSGNNYAAVEYVDSTGVLKKQFAFSDSGYHSEEILAMQLKNEGVDLRNVRRFYSEREPCDSGYKNCADLVSRYPSAQVTYSFAYFDPAVRTASRNAFRRYIYHISGTYSP